MYSRRGCFSAAGRIPPRSQYSSSHMDVGVTYQSSIVSLLYALDVLSIPPYPWHESPWRDTSFSRPVGTSTASARPLWTRCCHFHTAQMLLDPTSAIAETSACLRLILPDHERVRAARHNELQNSPIPTLCRNAAARIRRCRKNFGTLWTEGNLTACMLTLLPCGVSVTACASCIARLSPPICHDRS
ncbi:hypothetical protein BD414DRAFT_195402 [Trametes punicea]|nr:hypothetical protein BD414DRAFT_195402 [Trametes punicea]